jgi:hypothetical protein
MSPAILSHRRPGRRETVTRLNAVIFGHGITECQANKALKGRILRAIGLMLR